MNLVFSLSSKFSPHQSEQYEAFPISRMRHLPENYSDKNSPWTHSRTIAIGYGVAREASCRERKKCVNGSSAELLPCFAEMYSRSYSLVAFPIKLDISFSSFTRHDTSLASFPLSLYER